MKVSQFWLKYALHALRSRILKRCGEIEYGLVHTRRDIDGRAQFLAIKERTVTGDDNRLSRVRSGWDHKVVYKVGQ